MQPATDLLYRSACVWNELIEYSYHITYGYKNNLYTIYLTFSLEDFPHLAGFQYLKDISLPRYNLEKILPKILDKTITFDKIKNYVFIIKSASILSSKPVYRCCSTFEANERDYSANQRSLAILKKECIHIPSSQSNILIDKLTPQPMKKCSTLLTE